MIPLSNKYSEFFYFHQVGKEHWRLFIKDIGYLHVASYKKAEALLYIHPDTIKSSEYYITVDGRRIYLHAIITFNFNVSDKSSDVRAV